MVRSLALWAVGFAAVWSLPNPAFNQLAFKYYERQTRGAKPDS